jgi:hypothetical protein
MSGQCPKQMMFLRRGGGLGNQGWAAATFSPGGRPGCWCGGRGLRAVCSVQLEMRVAESCCIVVCVREVACQDGSTGRRFWWPARRDGAVGCEDGGLKL